MTGTSTILKKIKIRSLREMEINTERKERKTGEKKLLNFK
jgi:hypothetical protein